MAKSKKKYNVILLFFLLLLASVFSGAILIKNGMNMKFVFDFIIISVLTLLAGGSVIAMRYEKGSFLKVYLNGIITSLLVMPGLIGFSNISFSKNKDIIDILKHLDRDKFYYIAYGFIFIALLVVLYYLLCYLKGKSKSKKRKYK